MLRVAIAALVAIGLIFAARALWEQWEAGTIVTRDPALVAEGEPIYAARCSRCHAAAPAPGSPNAPRHDDSSGTWQKPDSEIFRILRQGKGEMPA